MGLDMYMERRRYIGNKYRDEDQKIKVTVPEPDKAFIPIRTPIEEDKITNITEEVGYWRKANAIHRYFVENAGGGEDNCQEMWLSPDVIKELYRRCKEVLRKSEISKGKVKNGYTIENGEKKWDWVDGEFIKNPRVAKELLPTQEGFFFGDTDYNQWYLDDIEETIKIIDSILEKDPLLAEDYYYQASW